MAVNTTTATYTIPEPSLQLYTSQQPSPTNSASPNSPRIVDYMQNNAPNPYKQLRPLKSPLYVPAVLRPTEYFPKPSLMTPPKSLHGSLDSLQEGDSIAEVQQTQDALDFDTFQSHWVQEEDLGDVTGPPTREHWKVSQTSISIQDIL